MTTDTRIESLETQVRTLKRMLLGVFGLVVVGVLLGWATPRTSPDVLRSKRLEILSDNGTPVVVLEASRVFDSVDQEGHFAGKLILQNDDGKQNASLGPGDFGGGSLSINNKDSVTVVALGSSINNGGSAFVNNSTGKTSAAISSSPTGAGWLTVNSKDGNRVVALGVRQDGGNVITWALDAMTITSRLPAPK
ncbi:MAG: hypothetical protein P8J86_09210 [Phycisphaerales bacterium]|nr:hypothetical protein [Phycisphaerales bacterium]